MADQTVFNFIVNSLKVAGAPYNIINNELVMAECQVNIPRTFFTPGRVETQSLQIVCHPDLLQKYPGSELVTQGSYRLQWFVDGIKQRGLLFKGAVAYDLDYRKVEREINGRLPTDRPPFFFRQPILTYQPNLLANFKVSLETDEKFEKLYSLSINLITGEIASDLLSNLSGQKLAHQFPKKHAEKKKIPYSEAFEALQNHLQWILKNLDPGWIETAKSRWEEEVTYLEEYYREEQEERDDAGFYRQVADIYRKFRPVIRIEIVNIALLYLPLISYTLEAWGSSKELPPICYDPVKQKVQWNQV
jgi:hypothetical protein